MMRYTNSSAIDGLSVAVSYMPSNGTVVESTTSWNVQYSGVEGLTVGYGQDENGTGVASTEVDSSAMFATYAYGPVTVGYQKSEDDAQQLLTLMSSLVMVFHTQYLTTYQLVTLKQHMI